MLPVCCDQNMVAGPHRYRIIVVLKEQLGLALQDNDPFGLVLIVPVAFR